MTDHWFVPGGDVRSTGVAVPPHAPGTQHGTTVAALVARVAPGRRVGSRP